jgi:hypothetical protein
MEDNLDWAYSRLKNTSIHTFLSGNAGTGKSTLLRKFMSEHEGEYIALAPTGIAAVNIGGQTIHSWFNFPARPVDYASLKQLTPQFDLPKIMVWKRIKYIIIDEISMVRADMMDQMYQFCQKNFPGLSFAGKKLIMVGDMDQLPPVVSSEEEKQMMRNRYKSEFWFSANCWKDNKGFPNPYEDPFETVMLTKVWRQKDPQFVELLNNIKHNKLAPFDLDNMNRKLVRDGRLNPTDGIMLCGTNSIALEVNTYMIQSLPGEAVTLAGTLVGDFNEKDCPVEKVLTLKPGCRVMTMRNSNDVDNQYYNGSLGTFESMFESQQFSEDGQDLGIVQCMRVRLDNGNLITVPQVEFENVKFVYDENKDKIVHTKVGSFFQYPIKLAYAITIHKSQGQTFEKVIIDLGRGAFAHGQVYVALSRCTTMEGITLRKPISKRDLIYNENIVEFNKR